MNTLAARLSFVLILVVTIMGGLVYSVDRVILRTYYDELTQKLNAPIAMYVTEQRQLIRDGSPDLQSLTDLANHAMVINPTAEIYLLDREGNILGHNIPDAPLQSATISIEPVRRLIEGRADFPVYGDDPLNPGDQKVFSAHSVESELGLEGYLYVILGGQRYEALALNIGNSYFAKLSAVVIAAIVILSAIVGSLIFALMTRRLRRLDRELKRVTSSNFDDQPDLVPARPERDEIDALNNAFIDMSAQIRQQIDQLSENDRLRRELVANISHDLRTPLSAMQGYVETLLLKGDAMSDEERKRFLTIARKHTIRLGVLISDLFELSKLDSATVVPSLERFSLPELVQDIAYEFEIEAERKSVSLDLDVQETTMLTLGDIGLIQRVIENLVRNAIRFTQSGGHVTISLAERPDAVSVAVVDDGPGISEADLPRIFDRFYRARDGHEARSDSSGIGLAIVKRILDLHNSQIRVVSEPGRGTEFRFDLPRIREAA